MEEQFFDVEITNPRMVEEVRNDRASHRSIVIGTTEEAGEITLFWEKGRLVGEATKAQAEYLSQVPEFVVEGYDPLPVDNTPKKNFLAEIDAYEARARNSTAGMLLTDSDAQQQLAELKGQIEALTRLGVGGTQAVATLSTRPLLDWKQLKDAPIDEIAIEQLKQLHDANSEEVIDPTAKGFRLKLLGAIGRILKGFPELNEQVHDILDEAELRRAIAAAEDEESDAVTSTDGK